MMAVERSTSDLSICMHKQLIVCTSNETKNTFFSRERNDDDDNDDDDDDNNKNCIHFSFGIGALMFTSILRIGT